MYLWKPMTQLFSANIYCVYPDCGTTNHLIYLKAEKAKKLKKRGFYKQKDSNVGINRIIGPKTLTVLKIRRKKENVFVEQSNKRTTSQQIHVSSPCSCGLFFLGGLVLHFQLFQGLLSQKEQSSENKEKVIDSLKRKRKRLA